MASKQAFRIIGVHPLTSRFKKHARKLSQASRDEMERVLDELLSGTLSSGRHLEKLSNDDQLYSVRLSRKQRLVFKLERDRMIRLVHVGNHDLAYRPKQHRRS